MSTLNQEIEKLKSKIKQLERISIIGLVAVVVILILKIEHINPPIITILLIIQIVKYSLQKKLKHRELMAKEVDERTQQIRFERDAVQEESEKLAEALEALAQAQDELVQQERMATVGQLTKGLVDRILNPLNYINNFANLTSGLTNDLRHNLEESRGKIAKDTYEESIELLDMMKGNLEKISEHGFNTVRIVKAMEDLLKDRRGNINLTNINDLCRIAIDKIKHSYENEIEQYKIDICFEPLNLPLMMEVSLEQLSNVLLSLLKNAMYAVVKKAEKKPYDAKILLKLAVERDKLMITLHDNGTGIDESIRDKVFAPFFTTKPTSEAAGVGLYLSREIIQNHRGSIGVSSVKGEYTEFVIAIPVYQPRTITPSEQPEEEPIKEKED